MKKFRDNIWNLGIFYWIFNTINQCFNLLLNGDLSNSDVSHLFATSLLLTSWFYLKPEASHKHASFKTKDISTLKYYKLD